MHRQIAPLAATLKNVLLDETVYLIILVLARDKREEKKTKKKRTVPDVSYPRCCLQTARGGDAEFDARGKWLVLEEWTETVHLP